ncbi:hypothetical protein [Aurantimonas marianensis]|uniref:Uncharacterized protein n=1 Tax=Aurantimonas marianensis TaxID=2920428 RepID=A0A9X2H9W6_9HYPH|nr:hypothetical protein [Aurantimonas marianensis]MCP3056503.1 hypothetical protein [Aurantimonas marianensis]
MGLLGRKTEDGGIETLACALPRHRGLYFCLHGDPCPALHFRSASQKFRRSVESFQLRQQKKLRPQFLIAGLDEARQGHRFATLCPDDPVAWGYRIKLKVERFRHGGGGRPRIGRTAGNDFGQKIRTVSRRCGSRGPDRRGVDAECCEYVLTSPLSRVPCGRRRFERQRERDRRSFSVIAWRRRTCGGFGGKRRLELQRIVAQSGHPLEFAAHACDLRQ